MPASVTGRPPHHNREHEFLYANRPCAGTASVHLHNLRWCLSLTLRTELAENAFSASSVNHFKLTHYPNPARRVAGAKECLLCCNESQSLLLLRKTNGKSRTAKCGDSGTDEEAAEKSGFARRVAGSMSQGLKPALFLRPLCRGDPRLKPRATSPGLSQKRVFPQPVNPCP